MKRFYLILASILISLAALGLSLAAPSALIARADPGSGHLSGDVPATSIMRHDPVAIKLAPSANTIQSDDFDTCTLSPFWTHVQGLPGDPSPTFSDTAISLDVPAGVDHDTFYAESYANRITQPAPDTDFEVEAKFDSGVGETWQTQGILVEQDKNNLLRFEFYGKVISGTNSIVTNTYAYASRIVNGTPTHVVSIGEPIAPGYTAPLYLRVKREGDLWSHMYSFNGADWMVYRTFTHTLEVTAISVYGGNVSEDFVSAPAHTAIIDYFYNTASPGSGDGPQTLTVNEVGNGSVDKIPNLSDYDCGQSVTLEATADPGWAFTGWSGDLSGFDNPGTIAITGDNVVTATFEVISTHTLALTTVGEGVIQVVPLKQNYIYNTGDIVTLTAIPDAGSAFVGWSGDLSGKTNPQVILIREDMAITATYGAFVYLPFIVTQ